MIDKYVNLSSSGSGHTGDTAIDPYTCTEWVTYLSTTRPSYFQVTFHMWGSASITGHVDLRSIAEGYPTIIEDTYLPYQPNINGPWRIQNTQTFYNNGCNLHGGIIDCGGFWIITDALMDSAGSLYNTYIICERFIMRDDALRTQYASGLSINCWNDAMLFGPGTQIFKDCLLSAYGITNIGDGPTALTFDNCFVEDTGGGFLSSNTTYTNCQQSVIAWPEAWPHSSIPFPLYDAVQSEFNKNTLLAEVNSPPRPGIGNTTDPKYQGYETDLWGNTRNDIGAVYITAAGPVIAIQPQSQQIELGGILNISVSATGTGTLHYQWKKNGNNIGTDSASFVSNPFNGSDQGTYTVDVTDSSSTVVSDPAIITFIPEPFVDFKGSHWDRNKPGFKQAAPATNIHIFGSNPISGERIVEENSTHY